MTSDDFDRQVRVRVYANTIDRGAPPSIAEVAAAMDCNRAEVAESFRRLAGAHVLVLQRDNGEILMAPPFSAVPTPFVVETERYATYAN